MISLATLLGSVGASADRSNRSATAIQPPHCPYEPCPRLSTLLPRWKQPARHHGKGASSALARHTLCSMRSCRVRNRNKHALRSARDSARTESNMERRPQMNPAQCRPTMSSIYSYPCSCICANMLLPVPARILGFCTHHKYSMFWEQDKATILLAAEFRSAS